MGKIIDISHHNTVTDWKKVKAEADLVIIRVQYGSRVIDRKKDTHIAMCKKLNIPFGLYAYGHFVSVADAKIEARDFIKRGDKDALFWVLDTEDDTILSCGTSHVAQASQAFINVLKEHGLKTGFYVANHRVGSNRLSTVKADFRWIPRYSGTAAKGLKPAYACDLWQYTESGRVNGIAGNVDLSVINGTKPLSWFLGESTKKKTTVKTASSTTKKKATATATTYVVKSGDTLSAIAKKHKTTIAKLQQLNGIKNANKIYAGQKLKVK